MIDSNKIRVFILSGVFKKKYNQHFSSINLYHRYINKQSVNVSSVLFYNNNIVLDQLIIGKTQYKVQNLNNLIVRDSVVAIALMVMCDQYDLRSFIITEIFIKIKKRFVSFRFLFGRSYVKYQGHFYF